MYGAAAAPAIATTAISAPHLLGEVPLRPEGGCDPGEAPQRIPHLAKN